MTDFNQGDWFYVQYGNRVGPLPTEAMGELIKDGIVTAKTRVWQVGNEECQGVAAALTDLDLYFKSAPPADALEYDGRLSDHPRFSGDPDRHVQKFGRRATDRPSAVPATSSGEVFPDKKIGLDSLHETTGGRKSASMGTLVKLLLVPLLITAGFWMGVVYKGLQPSPMEPMAVQVAFEGCLALDAAYYKLLGAGKRPADLTAAMVIQEAEAMLGPVEGFSCGYVPEPGEMRVTVAVNGQGISKKESWTAPRE